MTENEGDRERPRREGYGPYPHWREQTPEQRAAMWRFWLTVALVLAAIGQVSEWLG